MAKDKLRKFAEIGGFPNVFQLDEGKHLRGQWAEGHFGNNHPIILELGCGKGEYTYNLAKQFPDKNFVGIDYKGNRIWTGAKNALDEGIKNVAFLRTKIEWILDYFARGEVSEIWITFPDPQPQMSREKKRLTNITFQGKFKQILTPDGSVHLKTDSDQLYAYTKDVLNQLGVHIVASTDDVYQSPFLDDTLNIKTYYEKKYLSQLKNINYVCWNFNGV